MSLSEELEALRNIPMFANVEPTQLKLLAFTSQRLTFAAGQDLFRLGDVGDSAYIIISGEADVLVDKEGTEVAVAKAGKNEIVGEIAILCNVPRTATIRAVTELTALKIPKDLFFRLIAEFPDMGVQVMAELARRLHRTTQQLTEALAKLEDR
ncbi:MAG: cyclic nucleotide-binding domain-containing protein [Alphaproteobacteria bacterium]|nr:cyclic nucleotide-binding domain-containing protein [Pseudomonadota bacterium]MCH8138401.1 cyclic nucleotide-binding domain-containing protein [Pseudomonadota bacterium]MCZ6483272.1 cyclic nucleotide-binding domain-containing protein [Alphaproteobacteria bacterium]